MENMREVSRAVLDKIADIESELSAAQCWIEAEMHPMAIPRSHTGARQYLAWMRWGGRFRIVAHHYRIGSIRPLCECPVQTRLDLAPYLDDLAKLARARRDAYIKRADVPREDKAA